MKNIKKYFGEFTQIINIIYLAKTRKKVICVFQKYVQFLKENQEFETEFFEIGDRIGVSRRK